MLGKGKTVDEQMGWQVDEQEGGWVGAGWVGGWLVGAGWVGAGWGNEF